MILITIMICELLYVLLICFYKFYKYSISIEFLRVLLWSVNIMRLFREVIYLIEG